MILELKGLRATPPLKVLLLRAENLGLYPGYPQPLSWESSPDPSLLIPHLLVIISCQ